LNANILDEDGEKRKQSLRTRSGELNYEKRSSEISTSRGYGKKEGPEVGGRGAFGNDEKRSEMNDLAENHGWLVCEGVERRSGEEDALAGSYAKYTR